MAYKLSVRFLPLAYFVDMEKTEQIPPEHITKDD
jgi:hypothetical protein